jgi:lipopolysaccharide biosynthesis protein
MSDVTKTMMNDNVRLIAFNLPQYHPIPENDLWWGRGFTEWTNVAKATPRFPGHYQPHLPADLGFYDLRLPEARQAQADLAREYGVFGFCYYHYWFNGKRLLERPFDDILASGQPDFPFCLCWANETWSRRWTAEEKEILQPQEYGGEDDDRAHFKYLLKALCDPRAITVDGKPVFLVYRAWKLPEPIRTTDIWREEALKAGLPGLYLVSVGGHINVQPLKLGFDAVVDFQPDWGALYSIDNSLNKIKYGPNRLRRIIHPQWALDYISRQYESLRRSHNTQQLYSQLQVVEYCRAVDVLSGLLGKSFDHTVFPCVCPRWDNTPRRGDKGLVLVDDDPELFRLWLQRSIEYVSQSPVETRIVFINAWNEWGEGNHLEPDLRYGTAYLEAVRLATSNQTGRDAN